MRQGTTHLDRLSALTLIALFLTAQFAWLPLGALSGAARVIPSWSLCGNDLCTCAPTPWCPLCDGAPTCDRTDYSDTERPDAIIAVTDSIVAVIQNAPTSFDILAPHAPARSAAANTDVTSRDVGVPTPPPRA